VTTETEVTVVDGPQGRAEVFEVQGQAGFPAEYEVRFKGSRETFKSMGEAYITAKQKAGVEK